MSRGDAEDAPFIGQTGQERPLQPIVAHGTGYGRAARQIFFGEIANHLRFEGFAGIVFEVGNTQTVGQTGSLFGTTPSVVVQAEGDACHLVSGFLQLHGRHGAVGPSAHAQQYTFLHRSVC